MSKKLLDRVLGSLGFADDVEDDEPKSAQEKDEIDVKTKKSGTVVNLHTSQKQLKVIVIEPICFEEVQTIADHLRNRKPVIINLEQTEKDVAKRIVDFMSGTTYAVGGNMQKVGHNIFLFVPANVDIAIDQRDELDRSVFSWVNSR